MKIKEKNVRV